MKCLALVIIDIVALVAADEEWKPPSKEDVEELVKECHKEISPKNMVIKTFDEVIYQDTMCRVKKMGIFTEENGFSFDRIMAVFAAHNVDAEKSRRGIARCIATNRQTSTVAEWAHRTDMCLRKVELMNRIVEKQPWERE